MRYSLAVTLVLLTVLSISIAFAQADTEKGFSYLSGKVKESWGNVEENALSILALKNFDNQLAQEGITNLQSQSNNNGECWP